MNEDLTASIDQAVRAVCEGIARDAGVSPAKLHPSHLTFLTEIYKIRRQYSDGYWAGFEAGQEAKGILDANAPIQGLL